MAIVIRKKGNVRLRKSEPDDLIYKQGWVLQVGGVSPNLKRRTESVESRSAEESSDKDEGNQT